MKIRYPWAKKIGRSFQVSHNLYWSFTKYFYRILLKGNPKKLRSFIIAWVIHPYKGPLLFVLISYNLALTFVSTVFTPTYSTSILFKNTIVTYHCIQASPTSNSKYKKSHSVSYFLTLHYACDQNWLQCRIKCRVPCRKIIRTQDGNTRGWDKVWALLGTGLMHIWHTALMWALRTQHVPCAHVLCFLLSHRILQYVSCPSGTENFFYSLAQHS